MFCCCFPTFRGSGKKKTQNQCLFRCRRHWRNLRRLWPFGRSQPQVSQGSPGRAGQGRASTVNPPEQPHTPYTSSCVCVGGGKGKLGLRTARHVLVQVVSCKKPGRTVKFIPQVTAGRMGRVVLGTKLLHSLVNPQPLRRHLVTSLAGGLCRCPSGHDMCSRVCGRCLLQCQCPGRSLMPPCLVLGSLSIELQSYPGDRRGAG